MIDTLVVSQSGVSIVLAAETQSLRVSQSGIDAVLKSPIHPIRVAQSGITVVVCNPPDAATDLQVTLNANTAILTWIDNCTFETGYRVDRSGNGGVTWTTLTTLPINTTTYTDTTIIGNEVYTYRVATLNGLCYTYSNTITVSTLPRDTACYECANTDWTEGIAVLDADGIDPALIVYTLDRGNTWENSNAPFANTQNIMCVQAFDLTNNNKRWLIVPENDGVNNITVAYSDNASDYWTIVQVSALVGGAIDSGSLFVLDKYHLWLGVNGGHIFFSNDGGMTWEVQTTTTNQDIHAIHFSDEKYGIAALANGEVMITSDGGISWLRATDIAGLPNVNCAYRFNAHRAAVGTQNGSIYMTFNNGLSWVAKYTINGTITDIAFTDDFVGYASVVSNTIPPVGKMLRTKNGGQDWENILTPDCETINALATVTANLAFAGGLVSTTPFLAKING